jgi:hypothetical protein
VAVVVRVLLEEMREEVVEALLEELVDPHYYQQ